MKAEDTEALRRQNAKPSKVKARVDQPVRTARTTVHHYTTAQRRFS